MKVFKKLTALAVAMTMGCSVVALAACNPDSGDDGLDSGAPNLPKGTPVQTVDTSFTSALKEEKDYLSISYTNKVSGTDRNYTKTNGVETDTDTTTYEVNLTASGKLDLKKGDADLVAKSVAKYESTNKDKDFSYVLARDNYTEYDFLRSWNMFSYTSHEKEEVTDFTGLEFSHGGSANIDWEEVLGQLGSIVGGSANTYAEASTPGFDLSALPTTGDLAKLSLTTENTAIVKLAAAANTLKYENGVYSIDLIKTVDTVIKEVGSVVAALEGENTVGEILKNSIIKKYFSVITELVPVETVKTTVSTVIDGLAMVEDIKPLLLYIQQDLDALKTINASTTYDYIVSLISSQNLVNIANTVITIMQSQGGEATPTAEAPSQEGTLSSGFFTKTLDKYSINEILTIVNSMANPPAPITLQVLQNAYKTYVEPVCDGEKLVTGPKSAITELSVEYKVESGKLASQKVSYAFESETTLGMGSDSGNGSVTTYSYTDSKEKQEGTMEVTYDTSAPALKDISGNAVTYNEYVWDEETLDNFYVYDDEDNLKEFYVGAIVVDGEYAGYRIYDENKQSVAVGSQVFSAGRAQYIVVEENKSIGNSYSYVDFVVEKYADVGIYGSAWISTKEVERTSTVAAIIEANQ